MNSASEKGLSASDLDKYSTPSDVKPVPELIDYEGPEGPVSSGREDMIDLLDHIDLNATEYECSVVLRRIDMFCIPFMCLLNALAFLDKVCINYATVLNWSKDLSNMTTQQYGWLNIAQNIAMLVFTPPSIVLMQKAPIGYGKCVSLAMTIWGIDLALHATAFNYGAMLVCRFFIGALEACVTPGFITITGRFYRGSEIPTRTAYWFSMNGFGQVLGALISYGLLKQAPGKLERWREMFIILGGLTIIVGICSFLVLPSSPHEAWFLDRRQRLIAVERVRVNETSLGDPEWKWYQVKEALLDVRMWLMCICIGSLSVTNGAVLAFGAVVIESLGFDGEKTALLGQCSGWTEMVAIVLFCMVAKYTKPSIAGATAMMVAIAGAGMLVSNGSAAVRMAGYCLMFFYPCQYLVLYVALTNSVSGATKVSVWQSVFQIMVSVGMSSGPSSFRNHEAPSYTSAKIVILATLVFGHLCFCALFLCHYLENKRRDRMYGKPEEQKHMASDDLSDKTDKEKEAFFRYPL